VGLESEKRSITVRADNSNQAATPARINAGHGGDTWELKMTLDRNSNRLRCRVTIPSAVAKSETPMSITLCGVNGKVICTSEVVAEPGVGVVRWPGNPSHGPLAGGAYYLRIRGPGLYRIEPLVALRP